MTKNTCVFCIGKDWKFNDAQLHILRNGFLSAIEKGWRVPRLSLLLMRGNSTIHITTVQVQDTVFCTKLLYIFHPLSRGV